MATAEIPPSSFSVQDALVAAMVGVSASDENITTKELLSISRMVDTLPIFEGYDHDRLRTIGQTVFDLFTEEDGLDALFGLMRDALPETLRETAYALCCDVAAADGHAFQAELQFLLELRHELDIDRLHAAAIERGSAARHRRLAADVPARACSPEPPSRDAWKSSGPGGVKGAQHRRLRRLALDAFRPRALP